MLTAIEQLLGAPSSASVTVRPDHIMITDGPSHRVAERAARVARPDTVSVIFDHDVPTGSPDAAFILGRINRFARQYGCRFVQSVGIGYQWMLDELVQPGQIVVGGGRHASIFAAGGALGLNLDEDTLLRAVEDGCFTMRVPETVVVALCGKLSVSPLDAALSLLKLLGESARGKAISLVDRAGLSRHEKAVISAAACGTGAVTALFDDKAEPSLTLDLSACVPMLRMPCAARSEQDAAPIVALSEKKGTPVNAGQIGGVCGGTIEELRRAAALMQGKKLARGFRLSIVPASSRDYLMALNEGLIETFIDFNAQINAAGDRSVTWQGPGVIDRGESLITTGLYTFDGCMGVPGSTVYTASVDAVMAAAVTKEI